MAVVAIYLVEIGFVRVSEVFRKVTFVIEHYSRSSGIGEAVFSVRMSEIRMADVEASEFLGVTG